MSIRLSSIWFVALPCLVWATATLYVPIVAPALRPMEAWSVALAATLLFGASLVGHVLAHVGMARVLGSGLPRTILLYPFGDAAQRWPAAGTPQREALISLAGPSLNLLVAGVAFLVWQLQVHVYGNVTMIFLACANLALAVLNMAPGFPLDGGRLTCALVWGVLGHAALGTRLGVWLGRFLGGALGLWGVFLLLEGVRFSVITGASTICAAGVLLLAGWRQPPWRATHQPGRTVSLYSGRGLATGMLIFGLLALSCSLVPTTHGIQMPGVAVPLEPMISVPSAYRYPSRGSFLMTTVFEQTPIVAGQWVYGRLSPPSDIVPPERIVPRTITPQVQMQHSYQLLEQSELIATQVALRLAGYHVVEQGTGIAIVNTLPPRQGRKYLQPHDHMLRHHEAPLHAGTGLFAPGTAYDPAFSLNEKLVRTNRFLHLQQLFTPVMNRIAPRNITVRPVDYSSNAPFSVTITPQKIIGGPSVGLMFTLAVYNLITLEDLTGGRRIAGTGTINIAGEVGPIGGVAQKVAAAEAAGAAYFLVPTVNYAAAERAARRITVIPVATAEQAIEALRELPAVDVP